ncbi:hypothetical protein N9C39_04750 [Luminiphilus sp.]|nr:hypothetical protein [Luminiphilus sp.]
MSDRDLDHSRPLDVHRWSDYPEVDEWIDKFWHQHLVQYFEDAGGAGRKPQQTPRNMFKVLFLDLYILWLEDPAIRLGVSRTRSQYSPSSRYNALHISFKLVEVIDALLEQGFLDQHLGTESAGKVTRIWPLQSMIEYFKDAAFSEFMIGIHEKRETVILNSKEVIKGEGLEHSVQLKTAKPIPYEDSEDFRIVPTRHLLEQYNALLSQTHIDLGCEERPELITEEYNRATKEHEPRRISLSQRNKFVRRVFYRGDWSLGGRYHGGWWQQIPSRYRQHILIDGGHTIEADYSGFHIALAYALEGQEPPSDPYAFQNVLGQLTAEQQRADIKLLALTGINADSKKAAFKAFRDQRNRDQRNTPKEDRVSYTDDLLTQLLDTFLSGHEPIRHYLCTDKGVELMALDGNITTRIIRHFTEKGIPILTVHDSYILSSQHEMQLFEAMKTATARELGLEKAQIKQDRVSPTMIQTFKNMDRSFDDHSYYKTLNESIIKTDGYLDRLNRFNRFKEEYWPD